MKNIWIIALMLVFSATTTHAQMKKAKKNTSVAVETDAAKKAVSNTVSKQNTKTNNTKKTKATTTRASNRGGNSRSRYQAPAKKKASVPVGSTFSFSEEGDLILAEGVGQTAFMLNAFFFQTSFANSKVFAGYEDFVKTISKEEGEYLAQANFTGRLRWEGQYLYLYEVIDGAAKPTVYIDFVSPVYAKMVQDRLADAEMTRDERGAFLDYLEGGETPVDADVFGPDSLPDTEQTVFVLPKVDRVANKVVQIPLDRVVILFPRIKQSYFAASLIAELAKVEDGQDCYKDALYATHKHKDGTIKQISLASKYGEYYSKVVDAICESCQADTSEGAVVCYEPNSEGDVELLLNRRHRSMANAFGSVTIELLSDSKDECFAQINNVFYTNQQRKQQFWDEFMSYVFYGADLF